jgi:hypothetical protein
MVFPGMRRFKALKIAQTCVASMGTSETLGQLTIRLEMGQGRTVRFFIAPESQCAKARGIYFLWWPARRCLS